jgi:hypothetical protein
VYGFPGMKADSGDDDCRTFAQAEASAEIPFGVMVVQGAAQGQAVLPVDANSKPVGVVVHSHEYAKDTELGTTGLKPKTAMAVMNRGRIWVTVENAVAVNGDVYVRHTAGAGGTQKGAFRADADTATAMRVRGARFLSATAGAGIARVELDMPTNFAVVGLT